MNKNELDALLKNRKILDILDGDTDLGSYFLESQKSSINLFMPYLSGPKLCELSNLFGLPVAYGGKSRWMYLHDLMDFCVNNNLVSDLLTYLFSLKQFSESFDSYLRDDIETLYKNTVTAAINQINSILYFGKNELVLIGSRYEVKPIGIDVTVNTPAVKTIDRTYISELATRTEDDICKGNFDSAITKARTLLEEVFCYVIEKAGETPSDSGDIGKLYNQVKTLYNMHQDKDMDKRINMCLSGLEKILTSISQMRNEVSDSHGMGARRLTIAEHHTRLFINSAMTMADFILSVSSFKKSKML